MKNKIIFVACDTSNLNQIKKIIKDTKTNKLKIIPKFGLQFFYSKHGRKFLENFKSEFFLDVKLADISQTALSAMDSLKDLKKLRYITVHASGGLEMLKAVTKKAKMINKNIKVLVVTILTSLQLQKGPRLLTFYCNPRNILVAIDLLVRLPMPLNM